MSARRRPPVVAVSGIKNCGKTTFLEGLIPALRAQGVRTAVIKHDGHDFTPDVPGTDSWRMARAGAEGVAVYSARRWMVIRRQPGELDELLEQFTGLDLVLLEGQKDSDYPKIEVIRAAAGGRGVCRRETLLAVATDTGEAPPGVPVLGLEDYTAAADLILAQVFPGRRRN